MVIGVSSIDATETCHTYLPQRDALQVDNIETVLLGLHCLFPVSCCRYLVLLLFHEDNLAHQHQIHDLCWSGRASNRPS